MKIFGFSNGKTKLFARSDMDMVLDFIRAGLKARLDSRRINQMRGINVDFSHDTEIENATILLHELINGLDEIIARTEHLRKLAIENKNGAPLTADEENRLDMDSLRDIKKAGLGRKLDMTERANLKTATRRFGEIYSAELAKFKRTEMRAK
jgi:hypothetical protein